MRKAFIVLLGAAMVAGCGGRDQTQAAADSAARDIELPAADTTVTLSDQPAPGAAPATPAPAPRPPAARPTRPSPSPAPAPAPAPARGPASLAVGTSFNASSSVEITSRKNKAGETFTATLGEAVTASDGRVVIPAGSTVTLTIVQIAPAPNKSAKDGILKVEATSVSINGTSHPLNGEVTFIEHTLKGRGVGTSEAVKVGGGAAAGAIIGKVIGGGTGAAVGAVTGAAAGAAVAVETADRDVVVPVGGKITIVLRSAFSA